jgi:hypothetical protein
MKRDALFCHLFLGKIRDLESGMKQIFRSESRINIPDPQH